MIALSLTEKGIDCLLDWVEDIDINDPFHGMGDDDEDDDWSDPASSLLGDTSYIF